MTLQIVCFSFGALLLLAAIIGGGFELKELKIPKLARAARIFAFVLGVFFVGVPMFSDKIGLNLGQPDERAQTREQSRQTSDEAAARMSDMETNTDRLGNDIRNFTLARAEPRLCKDECRQDKTCKAWTYVRPGFQGDSAVCWLKWAAPVPTSNDCCISGTKLN
jgi:hypothetical protein